jgi:hypothetical protein
MFAKRVVYWMYWICLLKMLQHPVSTSSTSLPWSLPCYPGMSPALALFMNHVDSLTDFVLPVRLSVKSYLKTQQVDLLFSVTRRSHYCTLSGSTGRRPHCKNSSRQRTSSLIGRYQISKNRFEMATILISCFSLLHFLN